MSDLRFAAGRSLWGRVLLAGLLASVVAVGSIAISDDASTAPSPAAADVDAIIRPAVDRLDKPTPGDRRISLVVTALIKRDHVNRKTQSLDDEASQRCLKTLLKDIDPVKDYFLQSDVDDFMKKQTDLDDMLLEGDISFAYDVYKVFLQRVDERIAVVDELINMKHDFTLDEEMISDPDALAYAQTAEEARERWRKKIKYNLLVLKAEKKSEKEGKERLSRRYHSYARRMHQTDGDELLEIYLTAMTKGFDPHTTYMSPKTRENFDIQMRLNLDGIGAALQYVDGYTVVSKIIPGGAADKHGKLKPEDKIVGVGQGADGEIVDTVDMKLGDVVEMIRGQRGTVVRLEVILSGKTEHKIYNITRARIELTDSEARGEVIDYGKKADGTAYKIGVIDLPSFYMDMRAAQLGLPNFKSTTRDMQKILRDFREKKADAVAIDLRQNGGGSLTEAIRLTGLFIDHGPVVQVKDADGRVQHYDDLERGMEWEGPLVVITSKLSASASEIFAGAIQDYGRGLVIGDPATHGKGTVQSLLSLGRQLFRSLPNPPELGALKITMQQFYRPSGDSTQNRGVLADVVLPSLISQLDVGEADLDYAVPFDKVDEARHESFDLVNQKIKEQLAQRSAQRRAASEDFQKVLRRIERYQKQKERKTVSLNEAKFMAEREDDEKDEDKDDEKDPPVFKMDFYGKEVLAVTTDYLQLLDRRASE